MADTEELRAFRGAPDLHVRLLQLSLRHHRGEVVMRIAGATRAQLAAVRNLAQRMLAAQSAEIRAAGGLAHRLRGPVLT